jgi:signal transduction histidine kinase
MNRDERSVIESAAARGELSQRMLELQNTISALETFNRTVSHDLRAPIAGIVSLARLAEAALQRNDDSVARRMLPLIADQAECCTRMISALLDLARVEQVQLELRECDLKPLVLGVIDQLSLSQPGTPLPQVQVFRRLPLVIADEQVLRPALLNLMANAVKFTRGRRNPHIEVGGYSREQEATIFVRDNGVGFDAAAAAQLFEPFVRLHGANYDGHGVGLSIVRRAVERHGGRVWANSSAGRGACFFLTLRLARPFSAACVGPPAARTRDR